MHIEILTIDIFSSLRRFGYILLLFKTQRKITNFVVIIRIRVSSPSIISVIIACSSLASNIRISIIAKLVSQRIRKTRQKEFCFQFAFILPHNTVLCD